MPPLKHTLWIAAVITYIGGLVLSLYANISLVLHRGAKLKRLVRRTSSKSLKLASKTARLFV